MENEDRATELTTKNAGAIVPFDADFFKQDTVKTNLDIATMKGKVFAQKALSQADLNIDDLQDGTMFKMESCLIHDVELEDENQGGLVTAKRVVLISPTGETVAFVSKGVYSSMRNIVGLFGIGPWHPPLVLKAKKVSTRKKRTTINLEVLFEDDPGYTTVDA